MPSRWSAARRCHAGHDGSGRRPRTARKRLAVQAYTAGLTAGQSDGAGHAVIVRAGMERANDRVGVAELGELRKKLTDANAGNFGGDGREWTTKFERRARLWIPSVEVSRPAPQPQ